MPTCYYCSGTARCNGCGGRGVQFDSRVCALCGGSGTCQHCTGGQMRARLPEATMHWSRGYQPRAVAHLVAALLMGLNASAAWAQTAPPPPRIQDLIPDWANYVPVTGPLTFSTPQGAAYWSPCVAIMGANARPVPLPDNGICGPNIPPSAIPAVTILDASGRTILINVPRAANLAQVPNGFRISYSLTDTQIVRITNVGSGITANVRIAGTTSVLGSGSALTLNSAVAQALANANFSGLRGRVLPPVTTTTGIVQSDVVTGVSSVLTGRTDAVAIEDFLAGTSIVNGVRVLDAAVIGWVGRCAGRSSSSVSCESGIQYSLPIGTVFSILVLDTALTSTTIIDRTVTSTGLASVEIPIAAYGRAHPAAQTIGFDESSQFLARMLRGGDVRLGVPLSGSGGKVSLFLEAVAGGSDYRANGAIAASRVTAEGLRGGIAFAASPELTFGLAGEGVRGRWSLGDATLPERARHESWRIGGFVAWQQAGWRVQLAGFGGRHKVDSSTGSTFGGGTSTARYSANVYGAGVEVGRAVPVGSFTLTPSIGIDWLGWRAPAFTEADGLAPLSVAATSRNQLRSHAGLSADHRGAKWSIGAFARGTLVSGDRQGLVLARDGLSQTGSFAITGPSSNRSEAEMGGHVDYAISPSAMIGLSGAARIGSGVTSYGGQIGVSVSF